MDYNEIIKYIEDEKIKIQNDYYYHAFHYDQQKFISMLNEGIKSPILLGKQPFGYNGYFYVSLTKNEECEYSVYEQLNHLPMFIISSNIKTIKTKNFRRTTQYPKWIVDSFLPLRDSPHDNEYQKFLIVPAKNILGIQYNLHSICEKQNKESSKKEELLFLKNIITDLTTQKINLPIIDQSTSTIINKEKTLSLHL